MSVSFFSDGGLILHAKDIKGIDQESGPNKELAELCHIYLILSRPRVTYVPGTIVTTDEETCGEFKYFVEGVERRAVFKLGGQLESCYTIEIGPYPHTAFNMLIAGDVKHSIPAHLMSMIADVNCVDIKNLEVEYVGMSYGDGDRSAKDRLQSHSTLQAVLADLSYEAPDKEVLVAMINYAQPQVMMVFNGMDKSLKFEEDRNVMADYKAVSAGLSGDLQIALIEAALIKYFQPRYNDKYKQRFPNPSHVILEELYNVNIAALTVEINSEQFRSRFYSQSRSPGYHHVATYDLHDDQVRTSFFNAMNLPDGPNADAFSGPYY